MLAPNLVLVAALFAVCGVTIAVFETPTLPLIADIIGEEEGGEAYGAAFGLFNMAWSMGYLLGPAAGGFLAQKHGLPVAMILLSVPLLLIAWRVHDTL